MKIALYAALMVAVCLMVSVDARPGKFGRLERRRGPSSESSEASSEESGPRSGERKGSGPAPFGLCGICQVQDGAGAVLDVKTKDCLENDTCFTDAPKAVLQGGAGNVYRQLFVCSAQKDMTLAAIAEECKPAKSAESEETEETTEEPEETTEEPEETTDAPAPISP